MGTQELYNPPRLLHLPARTNRLLLADWKTGALKSILVNAGNVTRFAELTTCGIEIPGN